MPVSTSPIATLVRPRNIGTAPTRIGIPEALAERKLCLAYEAA
jgi:hypothetical protein